LADRISFFYIEEGCLSLPGAHIGVRTRSESVTVKYQDADGLEKIETFTEIDAVCVQHEMEHLAGESYLKHLNRHDRRKILKKYL
jgi:peptide deformylase